MNHIDFFELCEKYVYNQLNEEEKALLEKTINDNPRYKQTFYENVELLKTLKEHHQYHNFIENIKQAEKTISTIQSLKEKNITKIIFHYSSIAAVSIIAVLFTLYISGWFSYKHQPLYNYKQLSSTITKITKNQQSLINKIFGKEEITYLRGTAFLINNEGYLATSYHLIKDFDSVLVINASDTSTSFHAKVIYTAPTEDLAILKITDSTFNSHRPIPYIINFAFEPELGQPLYSLGFSKNSIVFGEGSISSYTGFNEDSLSFQLSIPTNPGNSGSPVFNNSGEIVGMICAKNFDKEGSSYAIKAQSIKKLVDSLNISLPKKNNIKFLPRSKQIKSIMPFIYKIEIYY